MGQRRARYRNANPRCKEIRCGIFLCEKAWPNNGLPDLRGRRDGGCPEGLLMAGIFLSVAMLGVIALTIGGGWLIANGRDRRRGILMLVAAAVLLGNVLILTL